MEQRISVAVRAFSITHSVDLPEDCSALEFIETFSNLAESVGFSPALVIKGLNKAIESRI